MRQALFVFAVLAATCAASAAWAQARSDDGTISIMREEGAPTPRHKAAKAKHRAKHQGKARHARGSSNPVYPMPLPAPQRPLAVPQYRVPVVRPAPTQPPLFVPQTGRTLPNLPPSGRGLGPGGTESFQQRAARCHQQAGIYGPNATGSPSAYINSCINQ
jgi:hypothetical protein